MRFLKIHLGGYIGIYNGTGNYNIDIDFTKCKHNKIVIIGDNGGGKSTLLNALSLFPESNSSFIPGIPADKKIELIDNNSTIYTISYVHGINSKMERETAKGYITKKHPGGKKENLNPNGNITSCKDIIYEEFGLDPNFIALSQLGSEDRGLVDKKPAERKRFINNIIGDELLVYNNIYKVLSKRSTELKGLANSITLKIKNLGDEPVLIAHIGGIEQRLESLKIEEDELISQIGGLRAEITSKDPDRKIELEYDELRTSYIHIKDSCDLLNNKIDSILSRLNISDRNTIIPLLEKIKEKKAELNIKLSVEEANITNLISKKEEDLKEIDNKNQKIKSLVSDNNIQDIEKEIKDVSKKIEDLDNIFKSIGIINLNNLSKEEYISGLNLMKDIKDNIDTFISNRYHSIIIEAIEYIQADSYPNIDDTNIIITKLEDDIKNIEKLLIEFRANQDIISRLDLRPTECKIDNCKFISNALEAKIKYPQEKIAELEKDLDDSVNKLNNMKVIRDKDIDIIEVINTLNNIMRSINSYGTVLNKLPNGDIFTDKNVFLNKLLNFNNFEEIDVLYEYIDYANAIDEYKIYKNRLMDLNELYNTFKSEILLINNIQSDIDIVSEKLTVLYKSIDDTRSEIFEIKNQISDFTDKEAILENIINDMSQFNQYNEQRINIENRFDSIRQAVIDIESCNSRISDIQNHIKTIKESRVPLENDKNRYMHNLQTLKEYKEELDTYMKEYNVIDTIRYYSSPNTGIQTLFIEMYMNKVLAMANNMLSMLFHSEYTIQPFIINEDEFRIPCLGNGYINDDISSMSTSEKCMISMIISFALLSQSATNFNILRLDEIDGGLDYHNRQIFNDLLNNYMSILHCEQCIFISHNSEGEYYDCDIIMLRNSSNRDIGSANIIFAL